MARGRMVNINISTSRKFNNLPDDTTRLLYVMLLINTDRDGRLEGDCWYVRSKAFPRRQDIDSGMVENMLLTLNESGLIRRYSADEETVIQIEKFRAGQSGMRYDREPESTLPPPPGILPADFRQDAAVLAAEEKGREWNRREQKESDGKQGKTAAKHPYGEYHRVKLTEKQHQNLLTEWGEFELARWIRELDEAIENKGLRYKNHALTLRAWRRRKDEGGREISPPLPVHSRPALNIPEAE